MNSSICFIVENILPSSLPFLSSQERSVKILNNLGHLNKTVYLFALCYFSLGFFVVPVFSIPINIISRVYLIICGVSLYKIFRKVFVTNQFKLACMSTEEELIKNDAFKEISIRERFLLLVKLAKSGELDAVRMLSKNILKINIFDKKNENTIIESAVNNFFENSSIKGNDELVWSSGRFSDFICQLIKDKKFDMVYILLPYSLICGASGLADIIVFASDIEKK